MILSNPSDGNSGGNSTGAAGVGSFEVADRIGNIISGRAVNVSDLTEPSEAKRRRIDGAGHARHAGLVQ